MQVVEEEVEKVRDETSMRTCAIVCLGKTLLTGRKREGEAAGRRRRAGL